MAGIGLEGRQPGQPPKAGQLTKLRQGPRDTIPIVGKSPRKQRSSRFHVTEKVHLEKLPAFSGEFRVPPVVSKPTCKWGMYEMLIGHGTGAGDGI
jgi:hypothetical protein